MKINAAAKYVRISPLKIRPLARLLKGLSLEQALTATGFSPKKGAFFIGKLLKSMAANMAGSKLNSDDFYVENIAIEQGAAMKRYWPRSRGMARPVIKRSCHIKIVLNDKQGKGKE